MSGIEVSIIVPAHNEERRLGGCLAAFAPLLGCPDWELIVVDDGSDDRTAQVAERHGARVLRHAQARGVAAARNHGAAAARGGILAFVDADIVAPIETLERMVAELRDDTRAAAAGARPRFSDLNQGFGPRFVELRAVAPFHGREADVIGFSSFQSECGVIRREVFEALGGFPERHTGVGMEEFELGHLLERSGHGSVLLMEARYEHAYKPLAARCRELARRTRRWVPLLASRRRLESHGAVGTGSEALSCALSGLVGVGLGASLVFPPAAALALPPALVQLVVERRFFALAWRQHGPGLALFAWPALQATHASIGLGFGLGLLRVVRRGLAKDVEGNP